MKRHLMAAELNLPPLPGLVYRDTIRTHGLRRGLFPAAAPRLPDDPFGLILTPMPPFPSLPLGRERGGKAVEGTVSPGLAPRTTLYRPFGATAQCDLPKGLISRITGTGHSCPVTKVR